MTMQIFLLDSGAVYLSLSAPAQPAQLLFASQAERALGRFNQSGKER
jgi:hypothetical protein